MANWLCLPKHLKQVYRETVTGLNNQQRILAAVGIRALLEGVCTHKKAKGKNLKERIDNLVTGGVVTKAQSRLLHKTRFLGNKAAHETAAADDNVLEAAMQVGEHMLTSVYIIRRVGRVIGKRK
jgi:Domain of unknown function (DUF4145)